MVFHTMRMARLIALMIVITVSGLFHSSGAPSSEEGKTLVGTRAREWKIHEWLNSEPLDLARLHGKVVLVRWWTGPDCPYCTTSAEALNEWAGKYQSRGLVVVGMYHHKSDLPLTREYVQAEVERLKFKFPVGIDENWKTLKKWWLTPGAEGGGRWTSVTFLIGRDGRIVHIHPGGAYKRGDTGYAALEAAIEKALEAE
jgi:peroxiredoxin